MSSLQNTWWRIRRTAPKATAPNPTRSHADRELWTHLPACLTLGSCAVAQRAATLRAPLAATYACTPHWRRMQLRRLAGPAACEVCVTMQLADLVAGNAGAEVQAIRVLAREVAQTLFLKQPLDRPMRKRRCSLRDWLANDWCQPRGLSGPLSCTHQTHTTRTHRGNICKPLPARRSLMGDLPAGSSILTGPSVANRLDVSSRRAASVSPVGPRKSGIPAAVEIPAPVNAIANAAA